MKEGRKEGRKESMKEGMNDVKEGRKEAQEVWQGRRKNEKENLNWQSHLLHSSLHQISIISYYTVPPFFSIDEFPPSSCFLVIFPSPRYSFISSSPFSFSILILYIFSSLLLLSSFPSVVSPFTDGRPSTSLRVCSWQKGVISTGRGKPGPRP